MITQIKYPSRTKGLLFAVFFSVLAHVVVVMTVRIAPVVSIMMRFREIEYVDEAYDRGILIDFSKRLKYPGGYAGFRAPEKTHTAEDAKKEEERLRRLAERRKREREAAEKRRAEELAKAEEKARAEAAAKKQAEAAKAGEGTDKAGADKAGADKGGAAGTTGGKPAAPKPATGAKAPAAPKAPGAPAATKAPGAQ